MQEVHDIVARKLHVFILLSLLVTLFITFSYADWSRWGDGENGIAICDAIESQTFPAIISDGEQGAIIVWADSRDGADDIYAQRINVYGTCQWTHNGAAICTATGTQFRFRAVPDSEGGAIIAWLDKRDSQSDSIFAQRVDSAGITKWTSNGVCIDTTAAPDASYIGLAPDGSGGAIVAWAKNQDIYVQRINGNGVNQWHDSITCICDASGTEMNPEIISDGSGGAIIAWMDDRDSATIDEIYAQRVNSSGTVQWDSNGLEIYSTNNYTASILKMVSDRNGGAIFAWLDGRNGGAKKTIWAQQIDSDGDVNWTSNGVEIDDCNGVTQYSYDIAIDSLGGIIASFSQGSGSDEDIYAVRIDINGIKRWTKNVAPKDKNQYKPAMCADSAGGVIIAFEDPTLDSPTNKNGFDIFCQRLDKDGNRQWGDNGVLVCEEDSAQTEIRLIYNEDWSAIITWKDGRDYLTLGHKYDIYAQRIEAPKPSCSLSYAYSDSVTTDSSGVFMNGCPAGDWHTLEVSIDFDDEDMLRDINSAEITLDKPDSLFIFLESGSIIADSNATKDNGYSTTITHSNFSHTFDNNKTCYTLDIPVRFTHFNDDPVDTLENYLSKSPDRNGDSIVYLSDMAYFGPTLNKCMSHDSFDCWLNYNGDTCIDISDFAEFSKHYHHEYDPPQQFRAPMEEVTSNIIAQFDASTVLEGSQTKHLITIYLENISGNKLLFMGIDFDWDKLAFENWSPNPSFKDRSAVAPISNAGGDWLATAALKLDYYSTNNIELGTLEFIVKDNSATIDENDIWINFADVLEENGNETRIQRYQYHQDSDTPTLTTRLSDNYPNPFNPSTIIEYSISKDTHVNLSIYNVNGQLVRTLVNEFQKKNHYKHIWDGRNNSGITVASGVYFLNMKTASYTMTKKLVILR